MTQKKVRMREGEEKGTVKVKRGIKGKKGQEGERKVKAEVGRNKRLQSINSILTSTPSPHFNLNYSLFAVHNL